MLNKIYSIVAIILFFVLSKSCISDYMKGGDNRAISNYEKMLFDNSTTLAELYPEYKEVTVKIMGAPVKHYEFRYKFYVDNMEYEGGHSFDNIPKTSFVKIYYLKKDPHFNCVNPDEKLKIEKQKNSSKNDLYWGIGWGVLFFLSLLMFIKELKKKKSTED